MKLFGVITPERLLGVFLLGSLHVNAMNIPKCNADKFVLLFLPRVRLHSESYEVQLLACHVSHQ